jgi:hypothetical protein
LDLLENFVAEATFICRIFLMTILSHRFVAFDGELSFQTLKNQLVLARSKLIITQMGIKKRRKYMGKKKPHQKMPQKKL